MLIEHDAIREEQWLFPNHAYVKNFPTASFQDKTHITPQNLEFDGWETVNCHKFKETN